MASGKSIPAQGMVYKNEEFTIRMNKIAKRKEWLKGIY